jgi:hypothetical protein
MDRCNLDPWLAFPFFRTFPKGPNQLHLLISRGGMTAAEVHAALNIPMLSVLHVANVIVAERNIRSKSEKQSLPPPRSSAAAADRTN